MSLGHQTAEPLSSGCVATQACANPECGREARMRRFWGRFCSARCRAADYDRKHPRQKALPLDPAPVPSEPKPAPNYHVQAMNLPASEVKAGEVRCKGQEQRLLAWLRAHPSEMLTRYSAAAVLGLTASSGGRALSNLRDAGYLRKRLDIRIPGPAGATVHPYQLSEIPPDAQGQELAEVPALQGTPAAVDQVAS